MAADNYQDSQSYHLHVKYLAYLGSGGDASHNQGVASLVGASRAVLAAGVEVFRLSLGDASLARHLDGEGMMR